MIYGVPTLNTLKFAILRRLDVVIPACLKLSTVDSKPQIRKPLCIITQDMARLLLTKYFQPYAVQNAGASVFVADLRRMLNKRAGETTILSIPGHHGIAGNEQAAATSLLRRRQRIIRNTYGPAALPLQNKGGLYQDVFMADRLPGCFHAASSSPVYHLVTPPS